MFLFMEYLRWWKEFNPLQDLFRSQSMPSDSLPHSHNRTYCCLSDSTRLLYVLYIRICLAHKRGHIENRPTGNRHRRYWHRNRSNPIRILLHIRMNTSRDHPDSILRLNVLRFHNGWGYNRLRSRFVCQPSNRVHRNRSNSYTPEYCPGKSAALYVLCRLHWNVHSFLMD